MRGVVPPQLACGYRGPGEETGLAGEEKRFTEEGLPKQGLPKESVSKEDPPREGVQLQA